MAFSTFHSVPHRKGDTAEPRSCLPPRPRSSPLTWGHDPHYGALSRACDSVPRPAAALSRDPQEQQSATHHQDTALSALSAHGARNAPTTPRTERGGPYMHPMSVLCFAGPVTVTERPSLKGIPVRALTRATPAGVPTFRPRPWCWDLVGTEPAGLGEGPSAASRPRCGARITGRRRGSPTTERTGLRVDRSGRRLLGGASEGPRRVLTVLRQVDQGWLIPVCSSENTGPQSSPCFPRGSPRRTQAQGSDVGRLHPSAGPFSSCVTASRTPARCSAEWACGGDAESLTLTGGRNWKAALCPSRESRPLCKRSEASRGARRAPQGSPGKERRQNSSRVGVF